MKRRWLGLVVWVALIAAALPLALRETDHLTAGGYAVPGSQAKEVEDILKHQVPADFRPTALAGVLVGGPRAPRSDYRAALRALRDAARATPGVELDPVAASFGLEAARQKPGKPAVVPLTVSASEFETFDVGRELRDRLGLADGRKYGAVRLHLVGAGALWAATLDQADSDLHRAERLAFPVVLAILLVAFGSLAAAVLPLALGATAIVIAAAAIYLLSSATQINAFTPSVASMLGLAVAVDYALFVVVRYREEKTQGTGHATALSAAMRTSGTTVTWSGLVLIAALVAVWFVDTAAIRSLAAGAILVVAAALAACWTLLPRLLDVVGPRLRPRPPRASFAHLADAVQRRPRFALAASLVLLALLAAPALGLAIGDGAINQLPRGNEARVGYEQARTVTGPGQGSPLKLLVARADLDRSVRIVGSDHEVVKTGVRTQTSDHRRILIIATPRHDGDSPETKQLVERLRRELPAATLVGGNPAAQVDFDAEVRSAMVPILAWGVLVTALLLLASLRSVPLAVAAVFTNLISVAVAFGVLTVVFDWGSLDGLLHFESPGYVDTITVPIIFTVVFGLSMDYQVFLLRRIRERWLETGDNRAAVRGGVISSAGTITSAAVVMIAVFAAFVVTGVPAMKEIGLGAAVATAVDATLIRLVLVPAAMTLAGPACWWAPRRPARARAHPAASA